jgi:hypothetical protein
MKPTIFVLLSLAMLVPRASSATPARVDNSDYGISNYGTTCDDVISSSEVSGLTYSVSPGIDAKCFFSKFSNAGFGFLVGFTSDVSDVKVEFSNATYLDAGLVICDTTLTDPDDSSSFTKPCHETPTWDLDTKGGLSLDTLFPFDLEKDSATFFVDGTISGLLDPGSDATLFGKQVAFLFLCTPSGRNPDTGELGVASDCNDVHIAVTSAVPEPASLLLCSSGAIMLARRVRNRRRS